MSITNEQMELIMSKQKELRIEFTEANLKKLKIEKKRYVAYDLKTTDLAEPVMKINFFINFLMTILGAI